MATAGKLSVVGVVTLILASAALAQTVISARSGLIHEVQGEAWIGDRQIETKAGEFPEIKENETFRTGLGRAEILLNSGVFLRVGENSSVRMISNRLIDTRIELTAGTAVVEVAEMLPDNNVTIVVGEGMVGLPKKGLYAFDAEPARVRVFDGEASVEIAGQTIRVKESYALPLDGKSEAAKFDNKAGDSLFRWSKQRAQYVSMANASAAHSVQQSGSSWTTGGWRYNPWYGMFTYIPASGILYSPFGYGFYSPASAWAYVYRPRPIYYGGGYSGYSAGANRIGYDARGGYTTAPRGMGPVVGSSPSAGISSPSAPSAPAAGGMGRIGGGAGRGASPGGGRGR